MKCGSKLIARYPFWGKATLLSSLFQRLLLVFTRLPGSFCPSPRSTPSLRRQRTEVGGEAPPPRLSSARRPALLGGNQALSAVGPWAVRQGVGGDWNPGNRSLENTRRPEFNGRWRGSADRKAENLWVLSVPVLARLLGGLLVACSRFLVRY